MKRFLWLIFVSMLVLVACGGQSEETPAPMQTPPPASPIFEPTWTPIPTRPFERQETSAESDPARVRVVQATGGGSDAAPIDIYYQNRVIGARYRPGSYSNTAVEVPSGEGLLRVVASGMISTPETALLEQTITLLPSQETVIYLYGETADSYEVASYNLDLSPLEAGTARVTFINAVAGASSLSVRSGEEAISESFDFGDAVGPFILPVGEYQFSFQTAVGTLAIHPQTILDQQVYSILLTGGRGQYQVIGFSEPSAPQFRFRLTHASPDSPPLRIFLNDEVIADNLAFQESVPDFFSVDAGRYRVRVERADGGDTAALVEQVLTFPAYTQAELLIFNQYVDLQANWFALDTSPILPDQSRLTVIHALPNQSALRIDVPNLIISESGFSERQLMLDVGFGSAVNPVQIGLGAGYVSVLGMNLNRETFHLYSSSEWIAESGQHYTYIVTSRKTEEGILLSIPLGIQEPETPLVVESLAKVRFVNMLRDGSAMTIDMDDESIVADLAFGEASPTLSAPALQGYELAFRVGDEVVSSGRYNALLDETITYVLLGTAEDIQVIELADPTQFTVPSGGYARFINGMYRTDGVLLRYFLASEGSSARLNDALLDANGQPILIRRLGSDYQYGHIAEVNETSGDYILIVYSQDPLTEIARVPFTIKPNEIYDFIPLETESGFRLMQVVRDLSVD